MNDGVDQFIGELFGREQDSTAAAARREPTLAEHATTLRNFFTTGVGDASEDPFRFTNTTDTANAAHQSMHQPQPSTIPPTSERILHQLPQIRIHPSDLVDPSNRDCAVCLEAIALDSICTRLPCAHCFHTACATEWLSKHSCMCPVCRYELPTDEPAYERERLIRMKSRKPRFARHELERLSVKELVKINVMQQQRQSNNHNRSNAASATSLGALDKRDIIQYLISSNCIDLVATPDPVSYKLSTLDGMSVRELKAVLHEAGVMFDPRQHVVEKRDMIQLFVVSGRLEVLPEDENDNDDDEVVPTTAAAGVIAANEWHADENTEEATILPVETVYSDSEDSDDKTGREPEINSSPLRSNLVMEENDAFRERGLPHESSHPEQNQSETSSRESINSDFLPAAATTSLPAAAAHVTAHENNSDSECAAPFDDSDDDATRRMRLYRDMKNMPLDQLCRWASDLRVDMTEYSARRERLDLDLATRLARASGLRARNYLAAPRSSSRSVNTSEIDASSNRLNQTRSAASSLPVDIHCTNFYSDLQQRPALLHDRSISELRQLGLHLSIDLSNCVERREIVERILASNAISSHSTAAVENSTATAEFVLNDDLPFSNWSVSEIRALANFVRIDLSICSHSRDSMLDAFRSAASTRPYVARYLHALVPFANLSIPQLRAVAREWRVSVSDCLEKGEILHRLVLSKTEE